MAQEVAEGVSVPMAARPMEMEDHRDLLSSRGGGDCHLGRPHVALGLLGPGLLYGHGELLPGTSGVVGAGHTVTWDRERSGL